ncbi:MAG: helix-turn-helix transcriptional regulator [Campylobacterota bacterium]|nr:helix-turn-helix transcriptional regulator [Campylobacterota bacterium]
MLSFLPKTPQEILIETSTKFRKKRKALGYTQLELSSRSGVSLGSLKRFEQSGQINFESLLKLALVLECLDSFASLCEEKEEMPKSIEELL